MKYEVLIAAKSMGSMPVVECGGVVLREGDRLLIHAGLYPTLKNHYGKFLLHVGQEEKESLRSGHYEFVSTGRKAASIAAADAHMPEPETIAISTDKMVTHKTTRVRRK